MKRQLNSAETTAHATMSSTVRTPTPGGSSVDEVARWLGRFMRIVLATFIVALSGLPSIVNAQASDPTSTANLLGSVHLANSCDPAVKPAFDRGVALLHSFWFSAAIETFNEVLERDPSCAMAEWGIALSEWSNPFGGYRSPQAVLAGAAAVERAKELGFKTERERAYVMAVDQLYKDSGSTSEAARERAYETAMAEVTASYPKDIEARVFYALAIDQDVDPTDKSYAQRLKAGAILEKEFAKQPNHPGIAHYIIHTYDVPPLASRSLVAARRYATIAPDAPHALHMPSHTFTRLGLWEESIDANVRSAGAAAEDPSAAAEQLHAQDYVVYAFLQTGQDEAARAVVGSIGPIGARISSAAPGNAAPPTAGYYARAAMPARYAIERDAWNEAAALQPHETPFPFVDSVTYFARGLGAARIGDVSAAVNDRDKLAQLRDALLASKDLYWAGQVAIQQLEVAAWIAFDEGHQGDAVSTMQEAALKEDATDKSAITPGPLKPARELLGEMLLRLDRPSEALEEFESVLQKEPNRFRATAEAAEAANALGDQTKTRMYQRRLVKLGVHGDTPAREEIQEARLSLTRDR